MPTNQYINNFESAPEQNLIHDLLIESIKFYGMDVYWLPRKTSATPDQLYGEDTLESFDMAHAIEMYIKNVEGFEGEGEFLSRFGLDIRDQPAQGPASNACASLCIERSLHHQQVVDELEGPTELLSVRFHSCDVVFRGASEDRSARANGGERARGLSIDDVVVVLGLGPQVTDVLELEKLSTCYLNARACYLLNYPNVVVSATLECKHK